MKDSAPSPQSSSEAPPAEAINPHYELRYPELSRWRRLQIPVIAGLVSGFARMIGPTMRLEALGEQHIERAHAAGQRCIYAFWHRTIFPIMWYARHRGIVVMNTTNFDGQWTRRVVERLGYLTAQGSSSRGGLKGLAVMARRLEEGHDVAFTIDGPRGPRYVAKPGPVMLARRTGCPIIAVHAAVRDGITLEKSWDLLRIPKPFTPYVVTIAPPILVAPDANAEEMERQHAEMQAALERVRDIGEAWYQFPPDEQERIRGEWNL